MPWRVPDKTVEASLPKKRIPVLAIFDVKTPGPPWGTGETVETIEVVFLDEYVELGQNGGNKRTGLAFYQNSSRGRLPLWPRCWTDIVEIPAELLKPKEAT